MWMAPEVHKSYNYSFSADVYSLGLVLYEVFERKLPAWDNFRQCVVLPQNFQSGSFIIPCLNLKPQLRPTADEVCKVLDKMIRNVVLSIINLLPQTEQESLKKEAAGDLEQEIQLLYRLLLTRPANDVDALINQAFNLKNQKYISKTDPRNQPPIQVPQGPPEQFLNNIPVGVPIAGISGAPVLGSSSIMGASVPTIFPAGYPPQVQGQAPRNF